MRWVGKHHTERTRADVCDFEVVGELKADPSHLLLLGGDGLFYALDTDSGHIQAMDPDGSMAADVMRDEPRRIEVPKHV